MLKLSLERYGASTERTSIDRAWPWSKGEEIEQLYRCHKEMWHHLAQSENYKQLNLEEWGIKGSRDRQRPGCNSLCVPNYEARSYLEGGGVPLRGFPGNEMVMVLILTAASK